MVAITDEAVTQCRKVLSIADGIEASVRIYVSGGCCYSFYGIDGTESGENGDASVKKDNLKVYVEPAVFEGFSEATLDYRDGLFMVSGHGRGAATGPLISMKGEKL
jgi:Fe-S cluster assembly iron-binding protein IscA